MTEDMDRREILEFAHEVAKMGQRSGITPEQGMLACLHVVAAVMVESVIANYGPYPQIVAMKDKKSDETVEVLQRLVAAGMRHLDTEIQLTIETS